MPVKKRGLGWALPSPAAPSRDAVTARHFPAYQAGVVFGGTDDSFGGVEIDVAAMQKRKASIVRQLTCGIAGLCKANKIEGLVGHGLVLPGR